jgi:hypothetical protein
MKGDGKAGPNKASATAQCTDGPGSWSGLDLDFFILKFRIIFILTIILFII